MTTQKIIVRIPKAGLTEGKKHVSIGAEGFKGGACSEATEAFRNALGTTHSEEHTAEYYETPEENRLTEDAE